MDLASQTLVSVAGLAIMGATAALLARIDQPAKGHLCTL
jgi:hypothetical protein